jgi:outer membrane lipoprotein-sorting protein
VIGAVLIFAFIIAALGAAQTVLVPQSNEEVEFKHNQEAQQDIQDLRGAIQRSAAVGASQSQSVDLSAEYPTRFLLLNPGEGAGTIRTAGGSSLTISNANATDKETEDFWDGSTVSAPSKRLVYSPSYNYYDNAPETVYENSVLYNRFSDGPDIAESDQDIVDGRQIYLTALDEDKSTSKSEAASVDIRSVSPATEKITVERDPSGGNVEVTIPTDLSQEVWVQDLLAEEIDDTNDGPLDGPEDGELCQNFASDTGNDRFISECDYNGGSITLIFEGTNSNGNPVTYSLKMAKIGVGTDISTPDAQYITDQKGDGADVALNGRQRIVFQVRDKYNNPADDAEVDVEITEGPGQLLNQGDDITGQSDDNIPVGPDGKVELTYVCPRHDRLKSHRRGYLGEVRWRLVR